MNVSSLRTGCVFVLGFLAPLWATWAVSQLAFAVSVLSDSSAASTAMQWLSIYLPSLVLGLVAGVVVVASAGEAPMKAWFVFLGALVLGMLVLSVYRGAPVKYLAETLGAVGNWFFVLGSAVVPVLMWTMRGTAAPVQKPIPDRRGAETQRQRRGEKQNSAGKRRN